MNGLHSEPAQTLASSDCASVSTSVTNCMRRAVFSPSTLEINHYLDNGPRSKCMEHTWTSDACSIGEIICSSRKLT